MTPLRPKQQAAVLVEISPSTRAVIYGRGAVTLLRGREAFTISDAEAAKLAAAHALFLGPVPE